MTLKLSLLIMDMTMTSYNGADHWSLNLQDYLSRIIVAYKKFFIVDWTLFIDRRLYFVFIVLLLFLMMRTIITVYKQNRGNGILLTGLFCLFPMIISFIYVMCPLDTIHALMLYSNTLVFIFFYLGERLELSTLVRGISTFLSALLIYTFVKYDNACYMKAMFNQHQAISYFTTLVTRIKSLPGYTDEKTVVFIGEGRVRDKSLAVPSGAFILFFIISSTRNLLITSTGCFHDEGSRLAKTEKSIHPLATTFTDGYKCKIMDDLLTNLANYVKPHDYLLCWQSISMIHYLTHTYPYLNNSWPWTYDSMNMERQFKRSENITVLPVVVCHKSQPPHWFSYYSEWDSEDAVDQSNFNKDKMRLFHTFIKSHNYQTVWENSVFRIMLPQK